MNKEFLGIVIIFLTGAQISFGQNLNLLDEENSQEDPRKNIDTSLFIGIWSLDTIYYIVQQNPEELNLPVEMGDISGQWTFKSDSSCLQITDTLSISGSWKLRSSYELWNLEVKFNSRKFGIEQEYYVEKLTAKELILFHTFNEQDFVALVYYVLSK